MTVKLPAAPPQKKDETARKPDNFKHGVYTVGHLIIGGNMGRSNIC